MKNKTYPEDLHIGRMIKEIVKQKNVPVTAQMIADLILKYQSNAHKIYDLDDMDCNDIVKISYLLGNNILDFLSKKYLSHLPFPNCEITVESRLMKFDLKKKKIMIYEPFAGYDFLSEVEIGQIIRKVAENKGWDETEMAKQLDCYQSNVSYLYKQTSLKVKKMIWLSEVLNHNLIAEAYLSRMTVVSSLNLVDGCIIALHPLPQVYIKNPNDETFSMVFRERNGKK